MKTNFLKQFLNLPDDPDPSAHFRDLIYPTVENNTSEGDEFLDDEIRMTEQPYYDAKEEAD